MRAPGLLLLLLCACGRTEPIEGFSSEFTPAMTSDAGSSACRQTCPGVPPRVVTPLLTGPGGVVLHWPQCEGCLRVTWQLGLQPYPLKRAVIDWDISFAGGMCLTMDEDAIPSMPADGRQTIHFALGEADTVTHEFDAATGALKSVKVVTPQWNNTQAAYLLGRAIGLGSSTDSSNSVMSYPNTVRDSPGMNDQTSLRALYGPPQAWCR